MRDAAILVLLVVLIVLLVCGAVAAVGGLLWVIWAGGALAAKISLTGSLVFVLSWLALMVVD